MPASKYIRMLRGRDAGQAVEAEVEIANNLIARGQAEAINFEEPHPLEPRRIPVASGEVKTAPASGKRKK